MRLESTRAKRVLRDNLPAIAKGIQAASEVIAAEVGDSLADAVPSFLLDGAVRANVTKQIKARAERIIADLEYQADNSP